MKRATFPMTMTAAKVIATMITTWMLLIFCNVVTQVSASFSVVVPFDEEVCFSVRTPSNGGKAVISGNYDILDQGSTRNTVHVVLHNSDGKELWSATSYESEGIFYVEGVSGKHEFCIINDFYGDDMYTPSNDAERSDATVGFSIRVTPIPRGMERENEQGPDDLLTTELLASTTQFGELLENMVDHQSYVRGREAIHRNLIENSFQRVVWWTVGEAIVLMIVASAQVLYLKKFFERRSYL